jgi:transcriptional regulator with XRE-family HTH domain
LTSIRQIKAARALLGWSQSDLAQHSGVSEPTIARLESGEGQLGGREGTVRKIQAALEISGIEFTNGDQPGVRLTKVPAARWDKLTKSGKSVRRQTTKATGKKR